MILTVFLLLISVIGLVAASIAWFTILRNNSVNNLNFYVKAPDTMMLSALSNPLISNEDDWKETLQKTEITDSNRGSQPYAFPENMTTVSSVFNGTFNGFFYGSHTKNGELNGFSPIEQQNHYVKISLWVKTTNNGFAYLNSSSFVRSLIENEPHGSIAASIRIGFVPVNYDENGKAPGGVIEGEAWQYAVVFEPNSKKHLSTYYGGPGGNGKIETHAIKEKVPISYPIDTNALENAASLQTTYDFTSGGTNVRGTNFYDLNQQPVNLVSDSKIALFNLRSNTMQQFNLYVWVEGADPDAIDSVAKSSFRTYLKFGQEVDMFIGDTFVPET